MKKLDQKAIDAGLKGIHWNLVAWGTAILPGQEAPLNNKELLEKLKFDSATSYVWIHHAGLPELETDFNYVRDKYMEHWDNAKKVWSSLLSECDYGMGSSPRTNQEKEWSGSKYGYPYTNTMSNNTPENFKKALEMTPG